MDLFEMINNLYNHVYNKAEEECEVNKIKWDKIKIDDIKVESKHKEIINSVLDFLNNGNFKPIRFQKLYNRFVIKCYTKVNFNLLVVLEPYKSDKTIKDMYLICLHPSNPSYIKYKVPYLPQEITDLMDLRLKMVSN